MTKPYSMFAAAVIAGALVAVSPVGAATPLPQIVVRVNSNLTLTVTNKAGKPVKDLAAGKYSLSVNDFSTKMNFHLLGPGVDIKTSVKGKGSSSWALSLKNGAFRYFSDAGPKSAKGSFRVG